MNEKQRSTATIYRLVESASDLRKVVKALDGQECYAIDTEFHREHTYYPSLALIQIAWDDQLVLIDPLRVDVSMLAHVFKGDSLAVLHASSHDLEVLQYATGHIPSRIFDTQIAAAFLGLTTPSLASLHEIFLGVKLPKANQLTDWLRRPLKEAQLKYAASDVERLVEIAEILTAELREVGRLEWAQCECELVRQKNYEHRAPEDAWLRIKQARSLSKDALARIQALAHWREETAQAANSPVRHIIPDLAMASLAQQPPKVPQDVPKTRGLERRGISPVYAKEIVEVLRIASENPEPREFPKPRGNSKLHKPAVALIAAWLRQFANDHKIDTAMIGSRADLEEFIRDPDSGKLSMGWRYDLVAAPILEILNGKAALAFDESNRIVVETRSFQPLLSEKH